MVAVSGFCGGGSCKSRNCGLGSGGGRGMRCGLPCSCGDAGKGSDGGGSGGGVSCRGSCGGGGITLGFWSCGGGSFVEFRLKVCQDLARIVSFSCEAQPPDDIALKLVDLLK